MRMYSVYDIYKPLTYINPETEVFAFSENNEVKSNKLIKQLFTSARLAWRNWDGEMQLWQPKSAVAFLKALYTIGNHC